MRAARQNARPGEVAPAPWIVRLMLSVVTVPSWFGDVGAVGQHALAQLGVMGAIAAVAMIAAFLV